jgi:hypothetical protein
MVCRKPRPFNTQQPVHASSIQLAQTVARTAKSAAKNGLFAAVSSQRQAVS